MLGRGCWCFTMLWIALTRPCLLLAVSVTWWWINALSLSHTHSKSHKHSDTLVHAERYVQLAHGTPISYSCQTFLSMPLRSVFLFEGCCGSTPFEATQVSSFWFREKGLWAALFVGLMSFFSLAAIRAGILCRVWRFLFVCVPPTPSGVGYSAPATEKSDSLWFIFANSVDQP